MTIPSRLPNETAWHVAPERQVGATNSVDSVAAQMRFWRGQWWEHGSMKRPYQITAVICLLFAAFIGHESLALKFYTSLGPGPGFFPFWLSVVLGILAVVMLCHATFGYSDPMPADFFATRRGYLRMAAILGSLVGTVILLHPLGFRLTSLAFYLFLLTALGRHGVLVTLLTAAAGSFGVYYVFDKLLMVPLPVGILGI